MANSKWQIAINDVITHFYTLHATRKTRSFGFTLIELIITLSIVSVLLSFITINLAGSSNKAAMNTAVTTLVTDMKQQQTNAMMGETDGSGGESYGIYFGTDKYVLFTGSAYDPTSESNLSVAYGDSIAIEEVTFPSSTLIFSRLNGEVENFDSLANTVSLINSANNDIKTIELNKFGVVVGIN